MARNSEFYKGTRKRRNYAVIPLLVLVSLIAVLVVLFGAMQKYAVISKDGVAVEVPFLTGKENTVVDAQGHEVTVFEPVDVSIVFDEPDYSNVKQIVKGRVQPLRAIFVSYDELNREKITEYAARLNTGNALVFEMKPRSGYLAWNSSAKMAMAYGTYSAAPGTFELPQMIEELKNAEKKVYLVAQISCLVDSTLANRDSFVALHNEYGGNYNDDYGMWLDPYNSEVREYVVTMIQELFDMGFDEVVLADVMHPNIEGTETKLSYTTDMSTAPGSVNGICGFAMYIAAQFSDRKGNLSIYVNSAPSLVKADPATGQNAPLFFKLFDRVFYLTDRAAYSYNLEDITKSVRAGKSTDRFVPVVYNYLPPDPTEVSWVLIDTESGD